MQSFDAGFLLVLLVLPSLTLKSVYYLDQTGDCGMAGYLDIPDGSLVTVKAKTNSDSTSKIPSCKLVFRAKESTSKLKISFGTYYITDCTVQLYINSIAYSCQPPEKPNDQKLDHQLTIKLIRKDDDRNYNFNMDIRTYTGRETISGDSTSTLPVEVIVSVVIGIVLLVILFTIICVCCFKQRHGKEEAQKTGGGDLLDPQPFSNSVCYTNETVKNGGPPTVNVSLQNKKKLHKFSDSSVKELSPPIVDLNSSPKKSAAFEFDEDPSIEVREDHKASSGNSRSSFLAALQNNVKFQTSFKINEADAEDRAKRISSSSSVPVTPTKQAPPLPEVSLSPRATSKDSHHAGICRAPRISSSSEEIEQLEKLLVNNEHMDNGIQLIEPDPKFPTSLDIVPIKLSDPHQSKPPLKVDTHHTLHPDKYHNLKIQQKSVDSQQSSPHQGRYKPRVAESSLNEGSLRKRGLKSPRLGSSSKPKRPTIDEVYRDDLPTRPDTPTSIISRATQLDDFDNISTLQRSGSKQSLYSSRTSLYGRRGKRDRHPSITDSVSTYAHDDMDAYRSSARADSYLPELEKQSAFKSLGNIGSMRESSTQILKKTVMQTGKSSSVSALSKKAISKKSTSSHKSSMSTQTSEQKGIQTDLRKEDAAKTAPTTRERSYLGAATVDQGTEPILAPSGGEGVSLQTIPQTQKLTEQPLTQGTDFSKPANSLKLQTRPLQLQSLNAHKSPWELLCELTDHPDSQAQADVPAELDFIHQPAFTGPSAGDFKSNPSVGYMPSAYAQRSYAHPVGNDAYSCKSSWEALKDLTDGHHQLPIDQSVSNV